jgi:benzoyl-CoA-dihydrodiol lyase
VLPGTGGLTRVTDKRKVRRDLADVFCTMEEGVKGKRARDWGWSTRWCRTRSSTRPWPNAPAPSPRRRPADAGDGGIALTPLDRRIARGWLGQLLADRTDGGPRRRAPRSPSRAPRRGAGRHGGGRGRGRAGYLLRLARELDDAILHLRLNETELGLMVFRSQGDPAVLAHEALLLENAGHWLANEILHYWKRVLKRLDVTSRSLVAVVEHGSCFAGPLAEILWAWTAAT